MIQLALYQPDIPQNLGSAIRLCACLDVPLHIIEPCGFPWDARKIRTSAMDYYDALSLQRHQSWESFKNSFDPPSPSIPLPGERESARSKQGEGKRIILLTTKTDLSYTDFAFQDGDILLMGRESAGVPLDIHQGADAQITIPMKPGMRSLNVINAAAMVLGEGLRQTEWKL